VRFIGKNLSSEHLRKINFIQAVVPNVTRAGDASVKTARGCGLRTCHSGLVNFSAKDKSYLEEVVPVVDWDRVDRHH